MSWVEEVNAKWAKGREYQVQAVELMYVTMMEQSLNQKEVAKALNRSISWVCRMLKWRRDKYADTAFGAERQRQRRKRDCDVAISSQTADSRTEQLEFFSAPLGCKPAEHDANLLALDVERHCVEMRRLIEKLAPNLDQIMASAPQTVRQEALAGFATNINKTVAMLKMVATEVNASEEQNGSVDKPTPQDHSAPTLH